MVKGTLEPLEALLFWALLSLVDHWVKQLLLPPVTELAVLFVYAPLVVTLQELIVFPILAMLRIIIEKIRSSPEILKVVCIKTLRLVVVEVEGAPLGLEEGDVEIKVLI
jgi:hypothetical protein